MKKNHEEGFLSFAVNVSLEKFSCEAALVRIKSTWYNKQYKHMSSHEPEPEPS